MERSAIRPNGFDSSVATRPHGLEVIPSYWAWYHAVQLLLRPYEAVAIAVRAGSVHSGAGVPFAHRCATWLQQQFAQGRLRYLSDPAGRDTWWSPYATIARRGGDCEDLSILVCSALVAACRPSAVVFGLVWLGGQWIGHAWVEGFDEQGGFLLEATSGAVFREARPPSYRAAVAISKGRFMPLSPGHPLPTGGRGFGRVTSRPWVSAGA